MKRTKPLSQMTPERFSAMLASIDQDNFDDHMSRELLEEFIREGGGDPDRIWATFEPLIDGLLTKRAKLLSSR